ncbi:hypothetical protein pb186bvf_020371 [Paramecium bursaria]
MQIKQKFQSNAKQQIFNRIQQKIKTYGEQVYMQMGMLMNSFTHYIKKQFNLYSFVCLYHNTIQNSTINYNIGCGSVLDSNYIQFRIINNQSLIKEYSYQLQLIFKLSIYDPYFCLIKQRQSKIAGQITSQIQENMCCDGLEMQDYFQYFSHYL